ncbi:MAG: type II toxin-antitoxin system HicB family antitoxin [candidate division Zixibacteria bacterium]|nr:type II toxin-antitoxin system HicB family antitoxin [candidate division Zixibacteria bacterium]MBU1469603.1 type II toxin-antitoxin system HicB family antitoxin [candidate division Zixibacteria bacterium]MBU2625118.1 type II toxin-antitoxin system HicB family antitoxin [candidate division Zixibacteria bacterium]
MVYPIGVEDIEPNHWVAWVFDLPGCYSKARNREDAVANASSKIAEYFEWLTHYHYRTPQPTERIEIEVAESFRSFISEGDYIVNAFFEDDRRPLSRDEVEHVLKLLEFTRGDLFRVIRRISPEQLDRPIRGEVQSSIRGILNHVAWAEWWYFDRLNLAFKSEEMPEDVMSMLEKVRTHTRRRLPHLAGNTMITECIGERWSARKIVRRTLWHERAHTQQIIRYLGQ